MRGFSWVYQDKATAELVLVEKPHRRASSPKYAVARGSFKGGKLIADKTLQRAVTLLELTNKFEYIGGLNTGIKKKILKPITIDTYIHGGTFTQSQYEETFLELDLGQNGQLKMFFGNKGIQTRDIDMFQNVVRSGRKIKLTLEEA